MKSGEKNAVRFSKAAIIALLLVDLLSLFLVCIRYSKYSSFNSAATLANGMIALVPSVLFLTALFHHKSKHRKILLIAGGVVLLINEARSVISNIATLKSIMSISRITNIDPNPEAMYKILLIASLSMLFFAVFCVLDSITEFKYSKITTVFMALFLVIYGGARIGYWGWTITNYSIELDAIQISGILVNGVKWVVIFSYLSFRNNVVAQMNWAALEQSLVQAKKAYEEGTITAEEYHRKKETILSEV